MNEQDISLDLVVVRAPYTKIYYNKKGKKDTAGFVPVKDKNGNVVKRMFNRTGTNLYYATDKYGNIIGVTNDDSKLDSEDPINSTKWFDYRDPNVRDNFASVVIENDKANENEYDLHAANKQRAYQDRLNQNIRNATTQAANLITKNLPTRYLPHLAYSGIRAANPLDNYTANDFINGISTYSTSSQGLGDVLLGAANGLGYNTNSNIGKSVQLLGNIIGDYGFWYGAQNVDPEYTYRLKGRYSDGSDIQLEDNAKVTGYTTNQRPLNVGDGVGGRFGLAVNKRGSHNQTQWHIPNKDISIPKFDPVEYYIQESITKDPAIGRFNPALFDTHETPDIPEDKRLQFNINTETYGKSRPGFDYIIRHGVPEKPKGKYKKRGFRSNSELVGYNRDNSGMVIFSGPGSSGSSKTHTGSYSMYTNR